MTDQQRFDTIADLGNPRIYTPNLDRLVRRGLTFSKAYASCPVCVAARYMIRTGCEPPTTRVFSNSAPKPVVGQAEKMEERCGRYLGRTMAGLGYRIFGIGKFHTAPWNEDLGYEILLRSEELYSAVTRNGDAYASWLSREHPEFDFLEQPLGERSEMYYIPQRSPLPAQLGVEAWVADRAVEQIPIRLTPVPTSDLFLLWDRIRHSRLQFHLIGCMIRTVCRIRFAAVLRTITWTKKFRICSTRFGLTR